MWRGGHPRYTEGWVRHLRVSMLVAAIAGLGGVAGCIPQDVGCNRDDDCSSGAECSNTHECLEPSSLMRVELRWTVNGLEPNPDDESICFDAGIARLAITYTDNDTADAPLQTTYDPVPCSLARTVYTKLPTWYDEVELAAWGTDGRLLTTETATIAWPETIVVFDLQP
jgi:hypothetical protein